MACLINLLNNGVDGVDGFYGVNGVFDNLPFLKADPTTIANAKRGTRFDGRMKKKLLRKKKKGETKVTFVNLVTLLH